MICEIWKPIDSCGNYEASSLGRIRSNLGRRPRILKQANGHNGYLLVSICDSGKKMTKRVSRLIATVFHGSRSPLWHVAHLDGDIKNNSAVNLKWKTPKENEADKIIHGTKSNGERHGAAILTEKQVFEIRSKYMRASYLKSNAVELANEYRVHKDTILKIMSGQTWRGG